MEIFCKKVTRKSVRTFFSCAAFLLSLLLIVSFTLPCFADTYNVNLNQMGLVYFYDSDNGFQKSWSTTTLSSISTEYKSIDPTEPVMVYVGFSAYISSTFEYTFHFSLSSPTSRTPLYSTFSNLYTGDDPSTINDKLSSYTQYPPPYLTLYCSASYSYTGTSSGNGPLQLDVIFSPDESSSADIYKYFPVLINTAAFSGTVGFTLSSVTLSYNAEDSQLVLEELTKVQGSLENIDSNIEIMVQKEGETKQAIDEAKEQISSDIQKQTQDITSSIENAPENEYDFITGKDAEMDSDVDDLQDSFDLSESSDEIFNLATEFWELISTTESASSLILKEGRVSLLGNEYVFWEEQTVDFSPFLENTWISLVLNLSKWISGVFLLFWIVRFLWNVISWFLGDYDGSITSIIFGFNPFDFGGKNE